MKRGALLYLGLTAILVMLLAACGSEGANGQSQVKRPIASPTRTLSWRQVALPNGVHLDSAGFAASPVNGQEAWICAPQTAHSFAIWVTMDAGNS